MNKNQLVIVGGILVPMTMMFVFAYWAWVSYLGFFSSVFFVTNWEHFNIMIVALYISGFFAGMSAAIIPIVSSMTQEAKRKQEREKLKEEIKREIEREKKQQTVE